MWGGILSGGVREGGWIKVAQHMAGHSNANETELYGRCNNGISVARGANRDIKKYDVYRNGMANRPVNSAPAKLCFLSLALVGVGDFLPANADCLPV